MSQNNFDRLLEWLGPDREKAAEKYEGIRLRLIRSYVCGGCGDDAEDLADRTIDRVIRKLEKGEVPEPYIGEKAHYFLGCAAYIRQEHFRAPSGSKAKYNPKAWLSTSTPDAGDPQYRQR